LRLLLKSLAWQTTAAPAPSSTTANVRVCIPVEASYAPACDAALQLLNDPTKNLYYRCIPGDTVAACLAMVNNGIVELAKLPGRGIYEGYTTYSKIKPIVNEVFSEDLDMADKEGYAVAAVSPSWCTSVDDGSRNPTLATLKGTNGCFSGYQRDGGWQIPVGRLFLDGGMAVTSKRKDYKDDAESVVDYFKDICAPGFYKYFPREDSKAYDRMCEVCGSGSACDTSDPHYGSIGALTCLNTPNNVVAFTEYPAIETNRGAGSFTPTVAPPPPTPSPPPTPVPVAVAPAATTPDDDANADTVAADPPTELEVFEPPPKAPKTPKPPKPSKNEEEAAPAPAPAAAPAAADGKGGGKDDDSNNNDNDGDSDDGSGGIIPPEGIIPPVGRRRLRHSSRSLLQTEDAVDYEGAGGGGADYGVDYDAEEANAGDAAAAAAAAASDAATPSTPTPTPTPTPVPTTADPNAVPLTALLCPKAGNPNENCRPMSEYATCNLGYIPAQAFIATEDWANSEQGRAVKEALVFAGSGSNPNFMNAAATAGLAPYWLVTPGTLRLAAVDKSAKDYLGGEFIKTMSAVDAVLSGEVNPENAAATGSGGDGGGGLSTAAIIGIAVGSILLVGGVAAGGIIYYNNSKKQQGWKKYQDAVRDIQRI